MKPVEPEGTVRRAVAVRRRARAFFACGAVAALALQVPAAAEVGAPQTDALASPALEQRRAAAEALSTPLDGPQAAAAVARAAAALNPADDERVRALVTAARHAGSEGDLFDLLLVSTPEPAVERTLAALCVMRGLAKTGTTPAVRLLVSFGWSARGMLRFEMTRLVHALDERATAALIEARGGALPDERAWAKDELEALGKRTPGDAVQTTNDTTLIDVLQAYADIKDPDALPVVLSFVNSDRTRVRAAAREATLAYGAEANAKVRSTYAALTGTHLPEDLSSNDAIERLFTAYDHQRLRDVYARLDGGLAKLQAGDLDGAIADFDVVLAREPLLDRRSEMATAYFSRGRTLEGMDPSLALDSLRRALRLESTESGADHVQAEIDYLRGEELLARGIADPTVFEHVLALDANHAAARAELERLHAAARTRRSHENEAAGATAATGLALVAAGVVALLLYRRRARATPSGALPRP